MTHKSNVDNKEYEIVTGNAYDLTFIMNYPTDEEYREAEERKECPRRVALVGWHFGEYEYQIAEEYIQEWIDNGKVHTDVCGEN